MKLREGEGTPNRMMRIRILAGYALRCDWAICRRFRRNYTGNAGGKTSERQNRAASTPKFWTGTINITEKLRLGIHRRRNVEKYPRCVGVVVRLMVSAELIVLF